MTEVNDEQSLIIERQDLLDELFVSEEAVVTWREDRDSTLTRRGRGRKNRSRRRKYGTSSSR